MTRRPSLALLALLVAPAFGSPLARPVVGLDDVTAWHAAPSEGVKVSLSGAQGAHGQALRVDFDFAGTAGYAAARRALPLALPPHYEISFYLRADAPVNTLQLKLVDASGENVWWVNRPNFQFPREWQLVRIKQRHIEFAWGPTKDRTLRNAAAVELVVAAGRGGGRGAVYLSRLVLREVPAESTVVPPPVVRASSSLPGAAASLALDGNVATAWKSDPAAGASQELIIDFRRPREFGGLIVRWHARAYASRYDVQFSDDGVRWRTVRRVIHGGGGPDALLLPESETRFLRLALHHGPARAYGVAELEIKDLAFGATPNAFFEALARASRRGTYPRGFSGEQASWTLVGIDGGRESGLLSEDGTLEVPESQIELPRRIGSEAQASARYQRQVAVRTGRCRWA